MNNESFPTNNPNNPPVYLNNADRDQVIVKSGHYLPHWTLENGIYNVRFRLVDSLPRQVRDELLTEKMQILENINKSGCCLASGDIKRLKLIYMEKVERLLDNGYGSCWLKEELIAKIVSESFKYFDQQRYLLNAWCIMPNHVHVVFQPVGNNKLSDILRSWKSFTAREANKLLNRTGQFWLPENFDRLIRNEEDLLKAVGYVFLNPEKIGCQEWKWRWKKD
jgi:REP element-mobilizing transposase RayT